MSELEGLQKALDEINKYIIHGELPGNGWDRTAQRNGMILASNLVMVLIEQVQSPHPNGGTP